MVVVPPERPADGPAFVADTGETRRSADRGLSSPIDVSIALVLIAASVLVVGGIDPLEPSRPAVSDSSLLGSTASVTFDGPSGNTTVTGTVGGLVSDAAVVAAVANDSTASAFVTAVEQTVDRRIERSNLPVQVIATCTVNGTPETDGRLVAGRRPPGDEPVSARVYNHPTEAGQTAPSSEGRCEPVVIVRRWSQ